MMKKIFIFSVLTPVILAVLFVFTIFTALNWPTLILNTRSLKLAAEYLKPIGIEISWSNASTDMKSHGYLDETIKAEFDDLCVAIKPKIEKACFKHVDLAGRYRFRALIPKLMSVGPINMQDAEIILNLPPKEKKKSFEPLNIPEVVLPYWLKDAMFFPINTEIKSIVIRQEKQEYTGNLKIEAKPDDSHKLSMISAMGDIGISPSGQKFNFDVTITSPAAFMKNIWRIEAGAKAALGRGMSADVNAQIDADEQKILKHELKLTFNKDKLSIRAELKGTLTEKEFEAKLTGSLNNISDILRQVNLPNCDLKLAAKETGRNRGEMNLNCPVDLMFKKFKLSSDTEKIYHPPEHVRVNVSSRADTFFMPDMDENINGTMDIKIQPTQSLLVKTVGGMKVAFSGVPSEPADKWKVETNLDIDFTIEEFSRLVQVLNSTKWPVPAPFNVLEGFLQLSLEGRISGISRFGHFPAKFTTRLKSEKQVIDVDSEGELDFAFAKDNSSKSRLKLDIRLNDVQLQLPDIAMAAIPSFTPDGRIILSPEQEVKKKTPSTFDYDLQVNTHAGNPVRILSNLTPKFVPINVNVDAKNEAYAGSVNIDNFPIKLFSREAHVQKLNFTLQEPLNMTIVDGAMSMQFPEIKIIIVMKGPVSSPSITLESDPPMAQGDIISTLLYGEPLTGIDSDQASSVNSMNAAMSDRAMALTSFFLLGSTPIQSIAYNPQSKVFAAKLRLGKKTSVTVGGSPSDKYAKIGRPLGAGFRISTGVDRNQDTNQTAATAMIEWSKRY